MVPLLEAAVDPPWASERAVAMDGGMKEGTYLPPAFLAAPAPEMLELMLAAAAAALAAAYSARQRQAVS